MISTELEIAIRRVLGNIGGDPREVWEPWTNVSYESGFDLPSFLAAFVWQDSKNKAISLRRTLPVYQEFAKIASIAPWSELLCVTEDGSSVTLNQLISDEDWRTIRDIANEYFGGVEYIPPDTKRS